MGRTGVVVAILLAVVLAAGCERTPGSKEASPVRTNVTLLHYFTDSISGGFPETANLFNAKDRAYRLNAIPLDHESFKTSIRQTLEAGNPPDLYSYWAGARTASIVEYLEPIDDAWQREGLDRRFPPALVKAACEYGGRKYLVPLTQHYVCFFYNKKVFDAHGVKPPKDWNEFLEACRRLKSAGVTPIALGAREKWPAQFWFDMILLRTAPYEFRQRLMEGKEGYDDRRVDAVFERWAQLVERGYFQPRPNDVSWDSGAVELVYRGEAAMTLMGTWIIGYLNDANHKWVAGKDYDFFPFPVIDPSIPDISLGPIDGLVLPRKAANREGAKRVMTFMTEAEPQQVISRGAGSLAPSLLVPGSFYSDIQRRIMKHVAQSAGFAFNYDLATPPAVAELGLDAFTEFLEFPAEHRNIRMKLAADAARQFRNPGTRR